MTLELALLVMQLLLVAATGYICRRTRDCLREVANQPKEVIGPPRSKSEADMWTEMVDLRTTLTKVLMTQNKWVRALGRKLHIPPAPEEAPTAIGAVPPSPDRRVRAYRPIPPVPPLNSATLGPLQ